MGATGFCFGGSIVWLMAVGNPELRAAVPFYGSAPPLEDVADMQVPVLEIYAGEDSRINAGVPNLEAELMAQQKDYKLVTYPGANHAFFNGTGGRLPPPGGGRGLAGSPRLVRRPSHGHLSPRLLQHRDSG